MSYNNIEFEISKGVAILKLNRPDSLNSFTAEMHGEVREALTLAASAANTLDEQLELEKALMRAAGKTCDYKEGVTAFLAKRTPVYKGE